MLNKWYGRVIDIHTQAPYSYFSYPKQKASRCSLNKLLSKL